jgi:hypothetical protein
MYEHHIVIWPPRDTVVKVVLNETQEQLLDRMSADGWGCFAIVQIDNALQFYFRRPRRDPLVSF